MLNFRLQKKQLKQTKERNIMKYKVTWLKQDLDHTVETGTQIIDWPAKSAANSVELSQHFTNTIKNAIGENAQVVSYERAHKLELVQ